METGYPSKDKTHLKGTSFFDRHPFVPNISISNAMDLLSLTYKNDPVIDCDNIEVTHKEFESDAKILARAFLELGVKPNDIITCAYKGNYQAVVAFKAANRIGAILTYTNFYENIEETKRKLNLYESKVFLSYDKSMNYNKEIMQDTKVETIISLPKIYENSRDFVDSSNIVIGNSDIIKYNELKLVADYYKKPYKTNFGGSQDAAILYSSGSTGEQKPLLFTNENFIAAGIYYKNSIELEKRTRDNLKWMQCVPFKYPYGFGASVISAILAGREVVLTPNLSSDTINYYYNKNPRIVFGSPAHLGLTTKYLKADADCSNLKMYVSGGDFLSVNQNKAGMEFFKKRKGHTIICNSSGNGELVGCSTNAMDVPYRPETVGKLVLGPEDIVIDPKTKKEVKYNEVGVLCSRGKHVFKGYYDDPERTEETMIKYNGKTYYNTGNLGMLDEDRYFKLMARESRYFIKANLDKVYLELVQRAVSNIDVVDSCVVVPKKINDVDYECKAYVVLKDDAMPTDEMKEYILEESLKPFESIDGKKLINLNDYEAPKSVTFLKDLPRTDADKLDYRLLESMALCEYNDEIAKKLIRN